ncbi:MAG: hypothetical protein UV79_C0009G0012 [candidate division TM6 bacterium GW2011_GWF2_43_17]|nr:MAG: hypothetical protein UV79_C0009G0012 [candidate division TM6 bacterium GW2011_GWF2_43_17]HAU30389.1 hypothetical protein [Candidatus Dependentiae bacterium]
MSKKNEPFFQLSEREVMIGILLVFASCFCLFFAGYVWGRYSTYQQSARDFSMELRRSLHAYTSGSFDVSGDDPLIEDFDSDNNGEGGEGERFVAEDSESLSKEQ